METTAERLLRRADEDLEAATAADEAWEQFRIAHLAALRAAGALVAPELGHRTRRRASGPVWAVVSREHPELAGWCASFMANARIRSAIDAGRLDVVDAAAAWAALCDAASFVAEVRALLAGDAVMTLRAS